MHIRVLAISASLSAFSCGLAHSQTISASAVQQQLTPATNSRLASYERQAFKGDYQAMRNIAFTWSTDAARERPEAAAVGCAWYALILQRHPSKADVGDTSNKDLYCGRLSQNQARQAGSLVVKIGMTMDDMKAGRQSTTHLTY